MASTPATVAAPTRDMHLWALTYLAQRLRKTVLENNGLRSDPSLRELVKEQWPSLLNLRATNKEAKKQLCEIELKGVLNSHAARTARLGDLDANNLEMAQLYWLKSQLVTNEPDLLQYIKTCVLGNDDYCVAGGFALRAALQYQSNYGVNPWEDGDLDVFIECEPGHAASLEVNQERLARAVNAAVQFFEGRGYNVESKRSGSGSAMDLLPLQSWQAHALDPFTVEELKRKVKELIASTNEHLRNAAGLGSLNDEGAAILSRVVDHIPAERRHRDWTLARALGENPWDRCAQAYIKVTNPANDATDKINIIGMTPAIQHDRRIATVVRDFDLEQCSVSIAAATGADGVPTLAFEGSPEALANVREGKRVMRLTEFSFEPILPMDSTQQAWDTESIRQSALDCAVTRQMSRIAKYILRGYDWE